MSPRAARPEPKPTHPDRNAAVDCRDLATADRAQQAQSLRDVARYAPGVYFSDDADFRFQNLNIRGFLADQYLDGMRLLSGTWSVPRIDPYFLERAEVISGSGIGPLRTGLTGRDRRSGQQAADRHASA